MRFVLLKHDTPAGVHWDFMLAVDAAGPLKTWRLAASPLDVEAPIQATPIGDHRRAYLDYEGPVSEGRGAVERCDAGEAVIGPSDEGRVWLELHGQRLAGEFVLETAGSGVLFRRVHGGH